MNNFKKYTCEANSTIAEVYNHIKNNTTFAIITKKICCRNIYSWRL